MDAASSSKGIVWKEGGHHNPVPGRGRIKRRKRHTRQSLKNPDGQGSGTILPRDAVITTKMIRDEKAAPANKAASMRNSHGRRDGVKHI